LRGICSAEGAEKKRRKILDRLSASNE